MTRLAKIIFVVSLFVQLSNSKIFSQSIPHLQKKGTTQELIVDNKPFLVLGGELGNSTAVVVPLAVNNASNISAGILQADEGKYINGEWVAGRRMNGEQDHQGRHIRIAVGEWNIQKVKLYQYK